MKSQRQTQNEEEGRNQSRDDGSDSDDGKLQASKSTFSWDKLCYTINAGGKNLTLLDGVQGYCKPGTLTALMGTFPDFVILL